MNRPERIENDTAALMRGIGEAAKAASRRLAHRHAGRKERSAHQRPRSAARARRRNSRANAKDIEAAKAAGRPAAFVDRLLLDEKRIAGIAKGA